MSRRDGQSSRYSSYSRDNRSDDIVSDFGYDDYAGRHRTRHSPSDRATNDRDSRSRSDHPFDDHRRPRTFDTDGRSLYDSSDDSSSAKSTATSASSATRAPSIRSAKSPRAALHRVNSNRRSLSPSSPEPSRRDTTPSGSQPLPPGWCTQFSDVHGRWYYYNRAMNKSQWEAPAHEEKKLKGILRNKADGGGRIRHDGSAKNAGVDSDGRSTGGKDIGGSSGSRRDDNNSKHDGHYHNGHNELRRKHSSLGTAGLLLGVAGGIAAGTMLARAMHGQKSRTTLTTESTVRRARSHSSFSD